MKLRIILWISAMILLYSHAKAQTFDIDYGCKGTVTVYLDETKTVYEPFWSSTAPNDASISWSTEKYSYGNLGDGFTIIEQAKEWCKIKGEFTCDIGKLYCKMTYKNTTYVAYYDVKVVSKGTVIVSANPSGGTVDEGSKVFLTASESGSTIYYTTDGSNPLYDKKTGAGLYNTKKYDSNGITLNNSCTIKAFGKKAGFETETSSWTYNVAASFTEINESNFPDENFRKWVLAKDYGKDGKLTESESKSVTYINCSGSLENPGNIKNLKGIEYFTALTELQCEFNQLTSLDVSKNTALTYLCCNRNLLTSLDVSKNTALTDLRCYGNQLTTLDVSKNTALTELQCHFNQLTALDVSKNTALTYLCCNRNLLTSLDVSKNTALTDLRCTSNQLTALVVSKNTALTILYCFNNQLTSLDVSENAVLEKLACYDNQLTSLDVSKNTALTLLHCHNNQLTSLVVSKNTALKDYLICYNNQIKGTAMDILVNSLPLNRTGKKYSFEIYDSSSTNEGNVCTKAQVAVAKERGWIPKYYNGSEWLDYEGTEDIKRGTEDNPFTPTEANEFGSSLAKNEQSEQDYYIRGMVSSIKEQFGTQYGNATFYISTDGTEKDQFYIYRALYLGNTKYAGQDLNIRVGDDVVVCGKITNYLGSLPETVQNKAYVVSINGQTTGIEDVLIDRQLDLPIYNLRGQRLTTPQKGINIISGKKVVIK